MFRIAICDTDIITRDKTKLMFENSLKKMIREYEIDLFEAGEEFVLNGLELKKYDGVILDIHMKNMNGLTTAKEIRKKNHDIGIVFVTNHLDYALEGYRVNALRYIIKDSSEFESEVRECIYAMLETHTESEKISIARKFLGGLSNITLTDIMYIESNLHKLVFHIRNSEQQEYMLYDTLDNMESYLPGRDFLRIHKSFLVNIHYVTAIQRHNVTLLNGEKVSISKSRYMEVKKYIEKYNINTNSVKKIPIL